jgi:hypothetical protein
MYADQALSWSGFLAVAAGVMATLSGLIFVAVSINLERILASPGLPDRAAESIVQLLGALIVCMIALVPNQPNLVIGVLLVVSGLALWILQTRLQFRSRSALTTIARTRPLISFVLPQFATLPFVVAGISLALDAHAAYDWLAAGILFAIITGVSNAWVLLVEIWR